MARTISNSKRGQVWTGSSMVFTKAVNASNSPFVKKTGYQPFYKMAGAKYKVTSRNKRTGGGSGG